jgi:hypothetical protein
MTASNLISVGPNPLKLIGTQVLGGIGVTGGITLVLLSIFGLNWLLSSGWAIVAVTGALVACACGTMALAAIIGRKPRVDIGPDGFLVRAVFGSRWRRWSDIEGNFTVIKIGWVKAVAYHLTTAYKTRVGRKPTSRLSGYDDAIFGAFQLAAEELAELLNAQKRQNSPPESAGLTRAVAGAQTSVPPYPAPVRAVPVEGNGSPVLRVAAGVLALLFAWLLPLMAAQGKLASADLVIMAAFALLFGWYAIRGRKGLPRFLTRKLGTEAGAVADRPRE